MNAQNPDKLVHQWQVRNLGQVDYQLAWAAMQRFTDQRSCETADECWWLQHPAVFTQGQAGKPEHLLNPGNIPIVQSDRGGQVTYHGPGQLVGYLMIDLKRRKMGVRELVTAIEQSLIHLLSTYQIDAHARRDAPGVYVQNGAKIAQLGLRVRKGCSFHGLSLNVDVDLEPFSRINPCGYKGLAVTSIARECGQTPDVDCLIKQLNEYLAAEMGYTEWQFITDGDLPI